MALSMSQVSSTVVSLQTAHSWANTGVLLGDACIGSGAAFEAIKATSWSTILYAHISATIQQIITKFSAVVTYVK